jgi:hypothetical protein
MPRDRWAIVRAYERCVELSDEGHPYLSARMIPVRVQLDERFRGVLRSCGDRVVVPHYDEDGLCGYEIRGPAYRGMARGSRRGLWISVGAGAGDAIVVLESAIDVLSHAALHPGVGYGYVATSGAVSQRQLELLRALMDALPSEMRMVVATDADEAGDRMAEQIMALVPGRAERERPPAKDWNDVLMGKATRVSVPGPGY